MNAPRTIVGEGKKMESLLYGLAVLACPVGMGAMMWMMMRGQRHDSGDAGGQQQVAQMRAEIDQLKIERGGYAELTVVDTGPGITDEDFPGCSSASSAAPGPAPGIGDRPGGGPELVTAHGEDISVDTRPRHTHCLVRLPHTAPQPHRRFTGSASPLSDIGVIRARSPHEE